MKVRAEKELYDTFQDAIIGVFLDWHFLHENNRYVRNIALRILIFCVYSKYEEDYLCLIT